MNEMHITAARVERVGDALHYAADISMRGRSHSLWFEGPADVLRHVTMDAFLIGCLPTAMTLGTPMVIDGDLSPRLLRNLPTTQAVFSKWYPELRPVQIDARSSSPRPAANGAGTAVFFSGGVDSLYSTYKNLADITALVLVHGFDMPLENFALRERVSSRLQTAATGLGRDLIEISTNIRSLTDQHVSWARAQFGPALAAVAVMLGSRVDRVLVPSSESYAHLEPCGSHPLLDPLWSTEAVEIVHDGAEASRNEKVEYLARMPGALAHLRVCWKNPDNRYNCGRCEKCLRTMLNLLTVDALDLAPVFDAELDARALEEMPITLDLVYFHIDENLRRLRQKGTRPELVAALQKAVTRYKAGHVVDHLTEVNPVAVAHELSRRATGRLRRMLRLAAFVRLFEKP